MAGTEAVFDVILVSFPPDRKIATIKTVRDVKAGLDLTEAKALVEGVPKPVLKAVSKATVNSAKRILEEAGARVSIGDSQPA